MLTRLTHAAIAFAITVVVYQAYVLLAAPIIEPQPTVLVSEKQISAEQREQAKQAVHKYRKLLTAYFPPGHWSLKQPPITAENGQTMLVLDQFDPRADGIVRVNKCAMIFFPNGRVRGEAPPSDAVVLEAPQGAILQMDKSSQGGMGGMGRLQSAKLIGQVTIHSDMRLPGPEDNMLLTASDINVSDGLIYTRNHVEMQLGPHEFSGRHLEIRMDTDKRKTTKSNDSQLGNIESLQIMQEVRATLSPGQVQLGMDTKPTADKKDDAPPVQISCAGLFRFNFTSQVSTFADQVRLQQVHPQGQLDQLHCEKLSIYFTSTTLDADEQTGKQNQSFGKLRPGLIEAVGSEKYPQVILDSQSQQASVKCERLRIEVDSRRITFEDQQEVVLRHQGKEIHAQQQIRYQAPPKDSPHRIGEFHAPGSGWLRAVTSDKPGAKPFEVRWLESMDLRRNNNGQAVLSLNGRPQLDMVGMGRLLANHLDLYLRESAVDGSEDDLLPGQVVPERLVASGKISINSAELDSEVKELEVRFEYASNDLTLPNADGTDSQTGKRLFNKDQGNKPQGKARDHKYDINGQTLKMLVTIRKDQREPEITSIDIDGQVVFNETALHSNDGKQPLNILADHLQVKNANSANAEIILTGRPATITGDGMKIRTVNLQINRGENRAWVNAPGEIEMLVDRDLSGKPLAQPQLMTIRWQRSMQLDRDLLTFTGNVELLTAEGKLDTQKMIVKLTAPVQFNGDSRKQKIELAQIYCSGGVNAIFSQRDALGLTSIQNIKLKETITFDLLTRKLIGNGPGTMESAHLAKESNSWNNLAKPNGRQRLASTRPTNSQAAQRLRFLGVQFVHGITGNLGKKKQISLHGDVEAVYGPIDAWEERISLTRRGMPGPDTIWINSQRLDVAESPLARLQAKSTDKIGPLELQAVGKVTIEGPMGDRGNFTARAPVAKYDQAKRTFILEGNNSQPATLARQEYRGGPWSTTAAHGFTYSQDSNDLKDIKIKSLMSGQFQQYVPPSGR